MFNILALNFSTAWKELKSNFLRTILSILGVTIGVFCIVSVKAVFDSLEKNIQSNMASLGNDVLYVGKYPWMPEDNKEYEWWKYMVRPPSNLDELKNIQEKSKTVSHSAICHSDASSSISANTKKINSVTVFSITYDFNKLQPIEIDKGRYFSLKEMESSLCNSIVLGNKVAEELFGANSNPQNEQVLIFGKKMKVIGVLENQSQTMTGFDFNNAVLISYPFYTSFNIINAQSGGGGVDPMLMLKLRKGANFEDMKYEVKGILRASRKIKPTSPDNFSFNQLDGIQNKISEIFGQVNLVGYIIGFFSIIVGVFSVANIMFVTVKERTSQIGLKKSIGAKQIHILLEFLFESILLCLFGGLLGIFFVFLLTKLISAQNDFPIYISLKNINFGIILSVLVGIISGYIPAKRAAKMNPVVAIRS